jgi:hypothetical protein
MDKALLRPAVFDVLRRTPQTHLHAIENEIRQRVEGYERGDALLVQEVVWDLLLQGVLAPGKNSLNLHLPFVHLTDYGQRCLDEGAIVAHDPDGYVERLRAGTGGAISDIVLESARDALLAFDRGLFRTSLILLSRAALELLREIRDADSSPGSPAASVPPELEALVHMAHSRAGGLALPSTDRESILGRLLVFPGQCQVAYTLIQERRRANA